MSDQLFLVLEPVNHMYKVIEAASKRGLRVVVFHSQPLTPPPPLDAALPCIAQAVAVDAWTDVGGVVARILCACDGARVAGTYAGLEITLPVEALVRRHYGLPGHDRDHVDFLLNKKRVRAALKDASLTALRFVDENQLASLSRWPFDGEGAAFLKPINGSGSAYVTRCTNVAEVQARLAEWNAQKRPVPGIVSDHLRRQGLFLEEEARGELLSLEGYVFDGEYVALGIADRAVLARDVAIEMGTAFPCPHPRLDEIVSKVRAIHHCLGVEHGATHTELIVPAGDGEIELVELNLRFAGADILVLLDRAFDVAFEVQLVELALGERPSRALPATPRCWASAHYILAPAGVREVASLEIPGDDVFFRKIMAPPGTKLKSTDYQSDWIAGFAVAAKSYDAVIARAREVRAGVTLNGTRLGNDPNNVVRGFSDGKKARYVAVVDGYSTGAELARQLVRAGVKLLHVQSAQTIPAQMRGSFDPGLFEANLVHDLLDVDRTVRYLAERSVEAVVPGTESGVILTDLLAARLGLRGNAPETSARRRDKFQMGEAVRGAGLSAVRQAEVADLDRDLPSVLAWNSWPLVVKPLASAGSEGVRFCNTPDEVREACASLLGTHTFMGDLNDGVLVQERLVGQQYVVNAMSIDGRHKITEIYRDDRIDVESAGNIYDRELLLPFPGEIQHQLVAYFKGCLDALGIRYGASHGEVMLTERGPVLVEVAARLQGGIVSSVIVESIGQSHATAAFDLYFDSDGFATRVDEPYTVQKHCMVVNLIARQSGVLKSNNCETLLRRLPSMHTIVRTPTPGSRVEKTVNLFTKAGHIYLMHGDLDQLEADYRAIRNWEAEGALLALE